MPISVPKISYSPGRHTPELDGVRGVAILLVMFFHCFPGFLTQGGWVGVDLFFVLSGFLITGILIDSKGSSRYYVNFIGRRILRIFPLYYMVLFIFLFLIPTFWKSLLPPDFSFYTQNQGWFWTYMQNWLYSFSGMPENHLLTHFWSLGVEEQFYLIWPLLVYFIPDRHLLKLSILLCLLAIVFRLLPLSWFHFTNLYRYSNTISRMDALLIGAIIAQLVRRNKRMLEKLAIPVGIAGLIVFVIGVMVTKSIHFWVLAPYYTAIDLFMGMILFLSLTNVQWITRILRWPLLTFFGKYSYGLYVYHFLIFILFDFHFGNMLSAYFTSSLMTMLVSGIITFVLALIVSVLSYHLFEVHFLKLKVLFRSSASMSTKNRMSARASKQKYHQ